MSLSPYLHFNGNCREAFEFYRAAFGGEFLVLQTFGDGPADMPIPADERNNVMHVSLPVGTSVLMGSDVPTTFGEPAPSVSNVSISYAANSREETDALFAKLSDGGTVTMPLQDMFWGAYFGACIDRFGVNWMLNCEEPRG